MDIEGMSNVQLINCARELRNRGYAVVIFNRGEIGDADARQLEDVMISRGHVYLSSFTPQEGE